MELRAGKEKVEATFLLKPLKIKGKCWIYIYNQKRSRERAEWIPDGSKGHVLGESVKEEMGSVEEHHDSRTTKQK